jgi:5-methylcytosine-specific restriction endonuclease McrA
MRREFNKHVKREAFMRAGGQCEGQPYGERCGVKLTLGKYHYDHVIPDGLGGEPVIENCAVLCLACHKDKTATKDVPAIAKTKRIQDRQKGIKRPRSIRSWRRFDGTIVHAERER